MYRKTFLDFSSVPASLEECSRLRCGVCPICFCCLLAKINSGPVCVCAFQCFSQMAIHKALLSHVDLRSQAPKIPTFCISLKFKLLKKLNFCSHCIKYKLGFLDQNLVACKLVVATEHIVTTKLCNNKQVNLPKWGWNQPCSLRMVCLCCCLRCADVASDAPKVPSAFEGATNHRFTLPLWRRQCSSYGWLQMNEVGSSCVKRTHTASGERITEGLVPCCIVWANVRALLLTVY